MINKWLLGGLVVGGAAAVYHFSQQPGGLAAAVTGSMSDDEVWQRYQSNPTYTMMPQMLRPTREQFLANWHQMPARVQSDVIRSLSMTSAQMRQEMSSNRQFAASMQQMTQAMMARAAQFNPAALRGIGGYHRSR